MIEELIKAIEDAKARLAEKEVRENFGWREILDIRDRFSPIYNPEISWEERQREMQLIEEFEDWCMSKEVEV